MTWAIKPNQCPNCNSTEYKEIGNWYMGKRFSIVAVCSECDREFTIPYLLVFDEDRWTEQYE